MKRFAILAVIMMAGGAVYAQNQISSLNGMPEPASSAPPAVADMGNSGNVMRYALENHTHASKVRKIRTQSAVDGSITWTFGTPFTQAPLCVAVAEVATGVTDVVNVQVVDTPTSTQAKLLVNRTNRSVAAVLGLTILSVPTNPGATWVHAICVEP